MSESNRPPQGSAMSAAAEGARSGTRPRRTKRLRVPIDAVPRLSDRPPAPVAAAAPTSSPPAAAAPISSPPPARSDEARREAETVKMRTVPPQAQSPVSVMPSVIVASTTQVVLGTPSTAPPAMAAATQQMHKETHASILPPPSADAATPARIRSDRAPRVVIDDGDDTLVEVPITLGASTRAKAVPATEVLIDMNQPTTGEMAVPASVRTSMPPAKAPIPESIPPARLDDDDLDDATEEDLKGPHAIAAPLPPTPTGRMSIPGNAAGAPPPPPARMSAPPPVPAAPAEAPTVVRLPPRPVQNPSTLGSVSMPPAVESTAPEAAKKKKRKPWWEDFFNDDFLRTVRAPTPEQVSRQCDFLEKSLGLLRGAMILDVGCGLGLQAIELASRGYVVVGLDLSLPMLARAGDEAQDRGMKINFLHSDMKDMAFEGSFDAVICLGTTFGYFDDETNRQVLERFRRSLKPHGILLLDSVNRDYVVQSQPNLVWFEGDGCVCMEETQFNYITSRLHVKRTMILEDRDQKESEYSVRLYPLHEIGQIMHNMGFRVTQISGMEATPGVYFGASSPRMILLAERRPEGGSPTGEMPKPPLPDEKTTPQAKRRSDPPSES